MKEVQKVPTYDHVHTKPALLDYVQMNAYHQLQSVVTDDSLLLPSAKKEPI